MSEKVKLFLKDKSLKILDELNDGIIITNKNCEVYYINPAYTLFSGLKPKEIVGKRLQDVRPGAILPKVLETLKPIHNAPRRVGQVESYCDYLPIIEEGILVAGLVIVKDVVKVKILLDKLKESEDKLYQLNRRIKDTFKARYTFNDIIGFNSNREYIKMAKKATNVDSTVLLTGESGTGKEVIAQSIHNASERFSNPFVPINCSALPEQLLESELYGYSGGAFTGAKKHGKLGLFELANGGTLFLDEITEMPLNLQSKLLRTIEERRIMKLGSERFVNLDIRIIAATNKNILNLVEENKFREDLYFRLAVFIINIPPLRDRKTDILPLVNKFIEEQIKSKKHIINISEEALKVLEGYDWPGNIRELKNAIEYACGITDNYIIDVEDLPKNIIKNYSIQGIFKNDRNGMDLNQIVSDIEKDVIKNYLNLYGNSIHAKNIISKELNISIATLYNKIKKYKL